MITAGIDLGDLNSSIAHVNHEGIPTVFPDALDPSQLCTPSLVHLGVDCAIVGDPVNRLLASDPELLVARHAKAALGSRAPLIDNASGQSLSSAAINALILAKLRHDAAVSALDDLGETVIAVPVHFGDAQRRAVRRAAQLAGIASVSLVDEPIAAATYLTRHKDREQTVLVYDFGGSSFNATILRSSPEEITTLASEHDRSIGGRWIDELIVEQMQVEWNRQFGDQGVPSVAELVELRRLAEAAKLKLRQSQQSQVRHHGLVGTRPFDFLLTDHHFQRLIGPQLQASMEVTERCLHAAELSWADIDQVMLIGGSSQIPLVRELIAERSSKPVDELQLRHPQHSVAFGAALLASEAHQQSQRIPMLRQATATYDLGVRIRHPRTGQLAIYNLIKRNSQLPSHATKVFKTSRNGQTRLVIEVVQSLGNTADTLSLGHFSFGPIDQPRNGYPIEVTMKYDHEGLVDVTARSAESGEEFARKLELAESELSTDEVDLEFEVVAQMTGQLS